MAPTHPAWRLPRQTHRPPWRSTGPNLRWTPTKIAATRYSGSALPPLPRLRGYLSPGARCAGRATPDFKDIIVPSTNPVPPAAAPRKRSMWPVYLIILICLTPVVLALLAYYVPSLGLRPEGHTNYGTLLQPQRPMPDSSALPLKTLDGQAFDLDSLRGKWLLVTADAAACPESCVRKLFILRNSHASQGKNVERLAR